MYGETVGTWVLRLIGETEPFGRKQHVCTRVSLATTVRLGIALHIEVQFQIIRRSKISQGVPGDLVVFIVCLAKDRLERNYGP